MLEICSHALLDSIKIIPFLFLTYLLMEYIEHKTNSKAGQVIKKAGKLGPIFGGVLGAVPQCGFSVSATNFYAGRVITLGTLISIYLSTSDEMLPILISEGIEIGLIIKILAIKVLIGMFCGFIIDLILRKGIKQETQNDISNMCEHEHCNCGNGILKSSIKHTVSVFVFIFIITLILSAIIHFIGEDYLKSLIISKPVIGSAIICAIGLIPNCASSVIITELFVSNVITLATMIGGLLVNSGLGMIVLFKVNHKLKENIKIVTIMYGIGIISAIILEGLI